MPLQFQHSFNHYQLLGIERSASSDEIRTAYLALVRKFHPDHFDEGSQEWEYANEFTRLLNVAYEVLSDPAKKKRYDESLGVRSFFTMRDAARRREEERRSREAKDDPWEKVFREQRAEQQAKQAKRLREKRLRDHCEEVCMHLGIIQSETYFDCLPDRVRENLLQLQREGIGQFKPIPEPSPWDSGWSWARCWTTVLSISIGVPLVTWLLAYWMGLDGHFIVYPAIIGQMFCVWKLTKKVRQQTQEVFRIKSASLGRYLYVTPLYVFTTEADKISFYPCHTVEITEELLLVNAVKVSFHSDGKILFETEIPQHESSALRKHFWDGLETIWDAYVNNDNSFFSKYNYFKYAFVYPHNSRKFSSSIPAYCFSLVVPLVSVVWASLSFFRELPLEKGQGRIPKTVYSNNTHKPASPGPTKGKPKAEKSRMLDANEFLGIGENPANFATDEEMTFPKQDGADGFGEIDLSPAHTADEFMAPFRGMKVADDGRLLAPPRKRTTPTAFRDGAPPRTDPIAEYRKTHTPLEPPFTGRYWNWSYRECVAPLKISAPAADNCFVKLVDHYTNIDVMGIFVRAGTTTEVEVPLGTYELRYAMGSVWYGPEKGCLFGPQTSCSKADTLFRFYESGNFINGHSVTLYRVRNGNMSTSTISLEDF